MITKSSLVMRQKGDEKHHRNRTEMGNRAFTIAKLKPNGDDYLPIKGCPF
jgi:hypothetical protein